MEREELQKGIIITQIRSPDLVLQDKHFDKCFILLLYLYRAKKKINAAWAFSSVEFKQCILHPGESVRDTLKVHLSCSSTKSLAVVHD